MAQPGGTDDLASLSQLDDGILLEELRCRYAKDNIYVGLCVLLCPYNISKAVDLSLLRFKFCSTMHA